MGTVLVVDDESDVRNLVRMNLELDGHLVLLDANGQDALHRLDAGDRPDVIVLDLVMPGIDGWEVLRRIKAHSDPAVNAIPVLLLTARTGDEERIMGGIEGAVRYLTKPFELRGLRQAVQEACSGDPEMVQRHRAQYAALTELARLERGGGPASDDEPRSHVHITRLERPSAATPPPPPPAVSPRLAGLAPKQLDMLKVVATTRTIRAAAEELGMSRTNVYAGLRRIVRKLELGSVGDLIGLARQGRLFDASSPRPPEPDRSGDEVLG
jgi:CheY-like chemotaxis protein/DNA-binding CsgD family transcriptional regulator